MPKQNPQLSISFYHPLKSYCLHLRNHVELGHHLTYLSIHYEWIIICIIETFSCYCNKNWHWSLFSNWCCVQICRANIITNEYDWLSGCFPPEHLSSTEELQDSAHLGKGLVSMKNKQFCFCSSYRVLCLGPYRQPIDLWRSCVPSINPTATSVVGWPSWMAISCRKLLPKHVFVDCLWFHCPIPQVLMIWN